MQQVTSIQSGDREMAEQVAARARDVFASGGLVVFPTETVYGVGAWAVDGGGYELLSKVKGRPKDQPFTVHLPDAASAERYADLSHPVTARFFRKLFPGPVTVVIGVSDEMIRGKMGAMGLSEQMAGRLYFGNTVGLRCPDHPLAQKLLGSVDGPVVASSANRRGEPPPYEVEQVDGGIREAAGLVVDGGRCRYAKASTIIRIDQGGDGVPRIEVQRAGVYDERYVRKMLRWTLLLVCSGNTCRSPMAEGIAKQLLAKAWRVGVDDLEGVGLRVVSAGTYAGVGQGPSVEAVETMSKMGIDIRGHRSSPATRDLIEEADVIYCMTAEHARAVVRVASSAGAKTFPLDPNGDIEDPIGSNTTIYQRCAEVIRRRLEQRLKELRP